MLSKVYFPTCVHITISALLLSVWADMEIEWEIVRRALPREGTQALTYVGVEDTTVTFDFMPNIPSAANDVFATTAPKLVRSKKKRSLASSQFERT